MFHASSPEPAPEPNPRTGLMLRLGVFLLGLLICGGLMVWLGPQLFGPQATAPRATPVPFTPTPTPPPPTPTFPCGEPTLTLGATQFQIKTIARAADGSVNVPADTPDMAYWVEGTNANYVFALSAAPGTLALESSLQAGDKADILWGDCSTEEYVVKTVEGGQSDASMLFDQSIGGVTAFVQSGPATVRLVIRGGRPEAQAVDTPSPTDANAIQAEISFGDTTTSADGQTVNLSISIKNTGPTVISLTAADLSLTVEGTEPLAPVSVEPALPREIQPGGSETFSITFPKPAANTAVFKILDFSVDIFF